MPCCQGCIQCQQAPHWFAAIFPANLRSCRVYDLIILCQACIQHQNTSEALRPAPWVMCLSQLVDRTLNWKCMPPGPPGPPGPPSPDSPASPCCISHRKMVSDNFKGWGRKALPAWHATGTRGVHQQSRQHLCVWKDCADDCIAQCFKGSPGHRSCVSLGLTAPHMLQRSASHMPNQV